MSACYVPHCEHQPCKPECENFIEGECETPHDNVRDYYEDTPSPEAEWLCENCRQNKSEIGHELMLERHYGG